MRRRLVSRLRSSVFWEAGMHIVYMHELSPLHTHSLGHFLTTLDLHVQILDACSIVQMYDETVRLARNRTLSFDSGILSFLYSCYYFIYFCISPLASILFLISFQIMCSLYMYYYSNP